MIAAGSVGAVTGLVRPIASRVALVGRAVAERVDFFLAAFLVLVDRGWIVASDNHADLPEVDVPTGTQKVLGQIWVPSNKFFTLSPPQVTKGQWQTLWQNMDMDAFAKAVPIKVLPVVIRMSPENQGGFVRNWIRPDDRIATHLGYAYQWFGFAFAAFGIYLFVGFKRGKQASIN